MISALGQEATDTAGDLLGVCGADYRRAGGLVRESLEISSDDKDLEWDDYTRFVVEI